MFCNLCKRVQDPPKNGSLMWGEGGGVKILRFDKVTEHRTSKYHTEALSLAAESSRCHLENKAVEILSEAVTSVVAALKLLYLLIKRPVIFFG